MKEQSKKIQNVVSGLMDFLEERGDKKLLPEVTRALEELRDNSKKITCAEVESVIQPTKQDVLTIKNFVRNFLKKDLPVKTKINKDLLGGFILRVGDWVLDASLRYELRKLNNLLLS